MKYRFYGNENPSDVAFPESNTVLRRLLHANLSFKNSVYSLQTQILIQKFRKHHTSI